MKSDGGFSQDSQIKASEILLSGPAGGLIGYSKMIKDFQKIADIKISNMIGLDMGGTSTDVSRVEDGKLTIQQTSEIQSVFVCSPKLEIDTIAAGGGSKLYFSNGMFKVGPESVGSCPGPVCYGIGDQLALTDANFILNRLDSSFFPKIFGKNHNQGLNLELTQKSFQKITSQINLASSQSKKTLYQVAEGFINIANELMARSARKLFIFGNPDALIVFGSAGGQHCCDVAEKLAVKNVFVHRYSGILSAYGLSKASQTKQVKFYLGLKVTKSEFNYKQIMKTIQDVKNKKNQTQKLQQQYDEVESFLVIGYVSTSFEISIPLTPNALQEFEKQHHKVNGFSLSGKEYRIQYLREKYMKHPPEFQIKDGTGQEQNIKDFVKKTDKVFMNGCWREIPFYDITNVKLSNLKGPAILVSSTATVFVKEGWNGKINEQIIHLSKQNQESLPKQDNNSKPLCDPIKLTLYSSRLMSIAQQMGKVLQRISISTNIKERLDFSCGIFDWNGKVLANAPHIPVHLGSMQTAVVEQINRGIQSGQSVLSNHPIAGGSHLPDITVISCQQLENGFKIYVASRGHHADIGGISPGSMPPFSKFIHEQGLAVQKFLLTDESGNFRQAQTREIFKHSRRIQDNISDLLAQLASNRIGLKLLQKFIKEQTVSEFKKYVGFICNNASSCVQDLLVEFSLKNKFKEKDSICTQEFMDDGTQLKLELTIDRSQKTAIFDFTGTGCQVLGNTNAPYSITRSAILYCLRSLIGKQIPLNSGCLQPIKIIVPQGTILSPSKESAVVGGNVETSQRIVDLIMKPFKYVAASQGTMNNFLFGNQKISYYETIGGGTGAGQNFNGTTCQVHMTNTRITDPEHLQSHYPVILTEFSLREGSGGKGKFKGGDGVVRQFLFLQPVQVSILSERRVFSPYGLEGGQNGQKGKNVYIRYCQDGRQKTQRVLGSKNVVKVQRFDRIRIQTPGGGGYGIQ